MKIRVLEEEEEERGNRERRKKRFKDGVVKIV